MTFVEQMAAAFAAQDMTALFTLAVQAGAKLDAAEEARAARREGSAERQRRHRARVTEIADSMGSVTRDMRDTALQSVTSVTPPSPSLSSPTPPINPSSPPEPLAQSKAGELAPDIDTAETLALALSNLLADRLPDVRRFIATRRRETWAAWMRQMLKLIGPGSQFTAADLADACNDALALEEPIAGPHALRAFIAKQRHERMVPPGTQTRVGRAITAQDADEKAAEQRRRNGLVSARRARGDGDLWWERMQRESGNPSPWTYAYDHMSESAEGPPRAA